MNQKTKYGNFEITGRMINGLRADIYTPGDSQYGTATVGLTHVTGKNDMSPVVTGNDGELSYRPYNHKCSCCYLGFTHSTALHDAETGGNLYTAKIYTVGSALEIRAETREELEKMIENHKQEKPHGVDIFYDGKLLTSITKW